MIEWLVNRIFRWDSLRKAVFDEVNLHQSVNRYSWEMEKDPGHNWVWMEGNTWYGWTYSKDKKRYYFDDIGDTSVMKLWEQQWAWENKL